MMNADECRKKAEAFLRIAQSAPDPVSMHNWRTLADTWLTLANQRSPLDVAQSPTTTKRPVDLAEQRRTAIDHEVSELLRERLGRASATTIQRPKSSQ